jgi:stage II sporulation protein D
MKRLLASLVLLFVLTPAAECQARTVRIGVLGIFHPQELTLAADETHELFVSAGNQQLFLRPRSECSVLTIRASGSEMRLACGGKEFRATELHAAGRNQQNADLILTVPGKLRRRYAGVLDLKSENGELIPVVKMDLETAVASAVAAETLPGTATEPLKAQAVVSRSYFIAGAGRHADFDFCDLTHCQLIREPPTADSPAAQAALATRNLVLTYQDKPFAAMFTPSCGGHTRTPQQVGLPQNGYPYYSVLCDYCHRYPVRWTRKVSREDAALMVLRGENGRLDVGRRLGWDAVPSNSFTAEEADAGVLLQGVGRGHGLGLCERGAREMAERGSEFRAILDHYFPNTQLRELASAK